MPGSPLNHGQQVFCWKLVDCIVLVSGLKLWENKKKTSEIPLMVVLKTVKTGNPMTSHPKQNSAILLHFPLVVKQKCALKVVVK